MIEAKEVLENLVKYNTIKDKENKEILDYLENTLKLLGFQTEKRGKILIMASQKEVALGFLGHTDTVEYTEGWEYEKFCVTKQGNLLYGLGICDMKAGIAAIISAISQVDFNQLSKGMKIYFTYDEEIGFAGIREVIAYEKKFPKVMLIGEPTNNEKIVGSKGLIEYKIAFRGRKTHSSTPNKGKNAIMQAVCFINELTQVYENEIKTQENKYFEIPYTTMNLGVIQGGSAINSVPEYCEFLVDFRTTGKEEEEKIKQTIQELQEKYQANVQTLNCLSAFLSSEEEEKKTCNFITEASFLPSGIRNIILGAGPVTAHEVNENITEESLENLVKQYKEIIEKECQ